jgi:phospholipid transport system substrate-binding protein
MMVAPYAIAATPHLLAIFGSQEFARRAAMTRYERAMTRSRRLLMLVFLTAATLGQPANAETAGNTPPTAPIEQLDGALLAAMKASGSTPFPGHHHTLVPVIEHVFNLDAVLAKSVGPSWETLSEAQKARLETAFRRYTVSSYVANFDSYNGQRFQVLAGDA